MLIPMNYNEGNAKTKKRDLILKKSCHLMAKHSLDKVTMIDIAKAAKIQRRTLYHYYNSKEKILHDIMINCVNDLYEKYFADALKTTTNQHQRLTALLNQILRISQEKPEMIIYISNYKNYFVTDPEYHLFFESFIRNQLFVQGEAFDSDGSIKVPEGVDFMAFAKVIVSSCLAVAFNVVQGQKFMPGNDSAFAPQHIRLMFNLALEALKA